MIPKPYGGYLATSTISEYAHIIPATDQEMDMQSMAVELMELQAGITDEDDTLSSSWNDAMEAAANYVDYAHTVSSIPSGHMLRSMKRPAEGGK